MSRGRLLAWIMMAIWARPALAALSIDPATLTNPAALLDPEIVKPIVRTIAFSTDHHAYEPATPLGTQLGLDAGIQISVFKIPDDFNAALKTAGGSSLTIPFFPVPHFNVHKGLGERVDVGASYIGYKQFRLYGADLKVAVFVPEEGPTWAIRMNYTYSTVKFTSGSSASIEFKTQCYKPEILVSRRLDFADPYIGIGYQYATGTLDFSLSVPPVETGGTTRVQASGFVSFLGVAMRFPPLGLIFTLDGEYSATGSHSMGTKIGFSF